jgi:mono/diheme cytochrome c family protein
LTQRMKWAGMLATVVIATLLVFNILREPTRRELALDSYQSEAIAAGTDLYAYNCAKCHGSAGEGLGVYRALDQEYIRNQDYHALFNTIERGRYNTEMAAFGVNEGGMLTNPQIDGLVLMLQHGSWETVSARVAELGMTPSELEVTAVSDFVAAASVDVAAVRDVYANTCVECHGENGEGTTKAPILNTSYVRNMPGDQLYSIVTSGVRNTEMAGFADTLSDETRAGLVYLLQNWDAVMGGEMVAAGPTATPEVVTETGQQLFEMWCAICHGVRGEGSAMAPSLNDIPALPADFVVSRVRSGKNAMPAFPQADLSDGRLNVLIEYAQNNIFGSGLPQFTPEQVQQGGELYVQQCAECHGMNGEGVVDSGPELVTLPPMHSSEITSFVRVGSANAEAFSTAQLSDADLALIVAYIHSLSP